MYHFVLLRAAYLVSPPASKYRRSESCHAHHSHEIREARLRDNRTEHDGAPRAVVHTLVLTCFHRHVNVLWVSVRRQGSV